MYKNIHVVRIGFSIFYTDKIFPDYPDTGKVQANNTVIIKTLRIKCKSLESLPRNTRTDLRKCDNTWRSICKKVFFKCVLANHSPREYLEFSLEASNVETAINTV